MFWLDASSLNLECELLSLRREMTLLSLTCHRQGYPDIRTIDYWIGGDKAERYPQSRYVTARSRGDLVAELLRSTMNSHNKAAGFERRLEVSGQSESRV